jgi:hypothetical protein
MVKFPQLWQDLAVSDVGLVRWCHNSEEGFLLRSELNLVTAVQAWFRRRRQVLGKPEVSFPHNRRLELGFI